MDHSGQYTFLKYWFNSINLRKLYYKEIFNLLKVLYVLYHDYPIHVVDDDTIAFPALDELLPSAKLFDDTFRFHQIGIRFREHHDEFATYPKSHLRDDEYCELVEELCYFLTYSSPDLIYPSELSKVFHYFIKKSKSRSIYNPFAGLASIAMTKYEPGTKYLGQDVNLPTSLAAKIRFDAHGLLHSYDYVCEDCLRDWHARQTDAVVAMMPLGIKIGDRSFGRHNLPDSYLNLTLEEFFYLRACEVNDAKIVVGCSSNSFCTSPRSVATREKLCSSRIIDTIIELPPVLLNTGMSPYIIVLTPQEKHDSIRFVNAKSLFTVEKKRKVLDVNALIHLFDPDDPTLVQHVSYEDVMNSSYFFSFDYYASLHQELKPNEKHTFLGHLFDYDRGVAFDYDESLITVSSKDFSSEFIEVCSMPTPEVSKSRESRSYKKFHGPHIMVLPGGENGMRIYWHRDDTDFCAINACLALRPKDKFEDDKISAEYLVYTLLNLHNVKDYLGGSYGMRITWNTFEKVPVVINPKDQDNIVDLAKKEAMRVRQAEIDAMGARLNLQRTASDIVHMLGTPWNNQEKIIRRIRKYKGDRNDAAYAENIEALISISEYVNRIVHAIDIDSMPCDETDINLFDFLRSYIQMMKQCDILDFRADIATYDEKIPVNVDETMLQVMMDSLFENARRHGFKKEVNEKNQVYILLDKVLYNDRSYALLSVRNNGLPFAEGFTVKDYISKGRFSGKSGRTGLGGYHVYTIAKKHDGFLNIRSDEEWNVIVDVLLPLRDGDNENIFTSYEYDTV